MPIYHRIRAVFLPLALAAALAMTGSLDLHAQTVSPAPLTARDGWLVARTALGFAKLSEKLDAAIEAHKMLAVTEASASEGAKMQGVKIPGNRIVGVFRNDFARRMLAASIAAGIEAPIRFYLVENPDGGATLAYRPPSRVFAPYFNESGGELKQLAAELDVIFAAIAKDALNP